MYDFIKQQLAHNQFFSAAVAASVMGGLIIWLKSVPVDLYRALIRRVIRKVTIYQNDPLYDDFEAWFFSKYTNKYRDVEAGTRKSKDGYSSPDGMYNSDSDRVIYYRQIDGFFIIRFKGRILFVKKGREKLEHASDVRSIYFDQYHISSLFSMRRIKELLEDCLRLSAESKKKNEIKLFTHNTYGEWYTYGSIASRTVDNIVLSSDFKTKLLADVDEFLNSKDWYVSTSVFYKRGYLFHGEPGNGKTSISLALANYTGRDLYILDLNSITENHHLKSCFSNIGKNSMLLIEDIDGFYNLRTPVKKDSKLSFSTFLNCLDGVFYKEGLITLITTNDISAVDCALRRAGRMDFVGEVKKPTAPEVIEYMKKFFQLDELQFAYGSDYSMCDIQKLCMEYNEDLKGLIHLFKLELEERYAVSI